MEVYTLSCSQHAWTNRWMEGISITPICSVKGGKNEFTRIIVMTKQPDIMVVTLGFNQTNSMIIICASIKYQHLIYDTKYFCSRLWIHPHTFFKINMHIYLCGISLFVVILGAVGADDGTVFCQMLGRPAFPLLFNKGNITIGGAFSIYSQISKPSLSMTEPPEPLMCSRYRIYLISMSSCFQQLIMI